MVGIGKRIKVVGRGGDLKSSQIHVGSLCTLRAKNQYKKLSSTYTWVKT